MCVHISADTYHPISYHISYHISTGSYGYPVATFEHAELQPCAHLSQVPGARTASVLPRTPVPLTSRGIYSILEQQWNMDVGGEVGSPMRPITGHQGVFGCIRVGLLGSLSCCGTPSIGALEYEIDWTAAPAHCF